MTAERPGTCDVRVHISVPRQQLHLYEGEALVRSYVVSTALHGVGEQSGSGCTPRGLHRVRAKVGAGCDAATVFVGRRPTGEVYSPGLAAEHPGRDWILCRLLWLTGCEPGFNRGGAVDTLRRYIYLHGCPDGTPPGRARFAWLRAHGECRRGGPVRTGGGGHAGAHRGIALRQALPVAGCHAPVTRAGHRRRLTSICPERPCPDSPPSPPAPCWRAPLLLP